MKIFKFLSVLFVCLALQACTGSKVVDVKSPCVSGEDGPCGPRNPVNTWLGNRSA